jgi:hypothetical protein
MGRQHVVKLLGWEIAADRQIQLAVGHVSARIDQRRMAVVDHQKLVALDDLALTLVDQIRECQTDMPARFVQHVTHDPSLAALVLL